MPDDTTLTQPERDQLARLIAERGEKALSAAAHVASHTVTRALAGQPVRHNNLRAIREAVAALMGPRP